MSAGRSSVLRCGSARTGSDNASELALERVAQETEVLVAAAEAPGVAHGDRKVDDTAETALKAFDLAKVLVQPVEAVL